MAEVSAALAARRRRRDRLATFAVGAAAAAVLVAITLILVYLIQTCLPLARAASLADAEVLHLAPASRYAVRESDGSLWRLPPPPGRALRGGRIERSVNRALLVLDGELHLYDLVPRIAFGEGLAATAPDAQWLGAVRGDAPPGDVAFDSSGSAALAAWFDARGTLHAVLFRAGRRTAFSARPVALPSPALQGGIVLADARRMEVLVLQGDRFLRWRIDAENDRGKSPVYGGQLAGVSGDVDAAAWGPGGETLLVADAGGSVHRFDTARRSLPRLEAAFAPGAAPVRWLASESDRRVAAVLTADDALFLVVPETGKVLLRTRIRDMATGSTLAMSADGSWLYEVGALPLRRWALDAGSPGTGWRSLWQAQHYSGYDGPVHSWHPEGSAIGVLPKYALSPLLWGTFKAALYGMLIAVPIALGAAIYTGYFLPPRRRNQVKPAVEMLEAFPTVVLGFIAGLWLAPLLADHLVVIFLAPLLLVLLPLAVAGAHLLLQRVSSRGLRRAPRLPVLALLYGIATVLLLTQGEMLENIFFGGSIRDWMWNALGIRYDQRNALLVGLAMGVAITPVMFSIIEDAINAVPRSLSDGSLALGATRWQSLARVVLPAASPAILSALLIGLARGLGETMIVLLASGNAPLMQADPFSGLRTLAASIAAELPEADAGGVHFRLLFLAALVLFALTFVLNTVAELFRQRLRYAYAAR